VQQTPGRAPNVTLLSDVAAPHPRMVNSSTPL